MKMLDCGKKAEEVRGSDGAITLTHTLPFSL